MTLRELMNSFKDHRIEKEARGIKKMSKEMTPDLKDTLLTWLQEKKDTLRFTIRNTNTNTSENTDLLNVMKGQLDAYSNTIAFLLTEGKLK